MAGINLGPDHALAIRLQQMEDAIKELSTRDVLQNASIGQGGLTVNGTGSINVTGGGSINVTGGGTVNVNGLPLSSLVPASEGASQSNFAIGTTAAVVCSTTVTVPAGYGTALIMSVNQADVYNSTGGATYVYASVGINGTPGAESDGSAPAGAAVTLTPAAIRSLDVSGLTSFTIDCRVHAGVAIAASAGNTATVNAIVLFIE